MPLVPQTTAATWRVLSNFQFACYFPLVPNLSMFTSRSCSNSFYSSVGHLLCWETRQVFIDVVSFPFSLSICIVVFVFVIHGSFVFSLS